MLFLAHLNLAIMEKMLSASFWLNDQLGHQSLLICTAIVLLEEGLQAGATMLSQSAYLDKILLPLPPQT